MNGHEKDILEVVANDVKWIRKEIEDTKDTFKEQVQFCHQEMLEMKKKTSDNTKKIYWILGVLAVGGVTGGTIAGVT